jgi:predicted transcriptional regulator
MRANLFRDTLEVGALFLALVMAPDQNKYPTRLADKVNKDQSITVRPLPNTDPVKADLLLLGHRPLYPENMADSKSIDPLVSAEEEVEVDAETAAAIERGIEAADQGRGVSSDEVRKLIPQWISKFSTPNRP